MARIIRKRITGLVPLVGILAEIVLSVLSSASAHAQTPEQNLAKRGLKASGWVYVLEAETSLTTKVAEARNLYREWSRTRGLLDEQATSQGMIAELSEQRDALKAEIATWKQHANNQNGNPQPGGFGQNAFNQPGGLLGPGGGFGQTGFSQQAQNAASGELAQTIAISEQSLAEITNEINRLRKLDMSEERAQKLRAEEEKQAKELRALASELRKSVDETLAQYKELRKDPAVEQAIAELGRSGSMKPKVGPSKSFVSDAKMLEKIERSLATGGSSDASPAKTYRKHKGKVGKPATKSTGRPRTKS